jgi:hypothetical protein
MFDYSLCLVSCHVICLDTVQKCEIYFYCFSQERKNTVSLISHLYRFRPKKRYYSLDDNVTVKIFNDMQYVNI